MHGTPIQVFHVVWYLAKSIDRTVMSDILVCMFPYTGIESSIHVPNKFI